jgi:hypothetical protein
VATLARARGLLSTEPAALTPDALGEAVTAALMAPARPRVEDVTLGERAEPHPPSVAGGHERYAG